MTPTSAKKDAETEQAQVAAVAAAKESVDPTPPAYPPGDEPDLSTPKDAEPAADAVLKALRSEQATKDAILEPLDRLVAEANGFFGEPSHIVAGAFHHLRVAGVTELSREQGRVVIDAWKSAEAGE